MATRKFGKVRRLASGRLQVSYVGPDGKRHFAPSTFTSQDDADAWRIDRRREIERGEWGAPRGKATEPQRVTVAELVEMYIGSRDLKPRTVEHYRKLAAQWIVPQLGDQTVEAITPALARRWYTRDLNAGTPTLRKHAYGLLRSAFKLAVSDGLVAANPVDIAGAATSKRKVRIVPATTAELAMIIEHMPPKYRAMVHLAATCALRFGELAELRRKDVDLDAGVIHVVRGVTRVEGDFVVGTPKSEAGRRAVDIPPHVIPALGDHLAQHVDRFSPNALLFPSADGVSHMAPSTLYKVWYPARKAAGRPDLRFHDLRHTGAVRAAEVGATLAELMERLGHSTPSAAMRYQHAAAGRGRIIAERMSQAYESEQRPS